jgi:hypothetical protein
VITFQSGCVTGFIVGVLIGITIVLLWINPPGSFDR